MNVPFSLPYIDKNVIDEVNDIFTNTGWLTSGPKVIEFESANYWRKMYDLYIFLAYVNKFKCI